ncbi:hypothetical protein IE81DRAFT_187245 [Ceraceosorus guamensis]|uniref:Na+/solute symporter n=1 Tax=Ceraceosorus guamensis TaxID=1522189 RepID=A0A316VUG1_9BASI|nr:hypothetical protein IE81DRAFT_187245 [Ceraceosorus guamensis]PWN41080.1 hypothetical protein IE81DRAFT_187245 [Ceraceosorus guamensis]
MDVSQGITPPISQGWAYGILLGVGLAFAVGMYFITRLLKKYNGEDNSKFETYATAGRTIGLGLTATAVVSSWAWSTALLSSSVVMYTYGVQGSFMFAAGCLVQISFFALLAIQSKRRTPHAHTMLEIVKARYGTTAHLIYMVLALITNLIASINMFLGASATISALTGQAIEAAIFLLPVGVVGYTLSGGLKATFITDYAHTVPLLIICIYLSVKAITNPAVGGLDTIWRNVTALAESSPVEGNYNGSYLTMKSQMGIAFGAVHTLGNFGLVIMDSSYWQKAFSASVAAATPGYILGGILYFGIPWCLGTIAGATALSLGNNPIWPAVGRKLTDSETANGLPLAYVALATAGKGGAVAVVWLIFFAVTSTVSAQLIAVSSIISSDVYHTYVNPKATEKSIILVSRLACIGFALVACAVSVVFYHIGLSLTWTLYFLGVIVCPGCFTTAGTVIWRKQSKVAAIAAPLIGLAAGLATWISTAYHYGDGILNVTTTGALIPCMWGNIVSFFVPCILAPILSYAFPDSNAWQWERFSDIKLIRDDDSINDSEKNEEGAFTAAQEAYMKKMSKVAAFAGIFLFLAVWVVWPFGMYVDYTFSLPFFKGWITVSLIWLFITLLVIAILPVYQGRHTIAFIVKSVLKGEAAARSQPNSKTQHDTPQLEQASSPSGTLTDSPKLKTAESTASPLTEAKV